ncbi:MAG TPA: M1 family metallopeptidase [Longimicrobium sp.]|nr:M1 family metallopeptidase [Longimicrobium sp.]
MTRLLCLGMSVLVACAGPTASTPKPPPKPPLIAEPAPPPRESRAEPVSPTLRLPATVRPIRAALDLTVVPGEAAYRGTADFELELFADTDVLWLNAQDLKVTKGWVEASGSSQRATPVRGEPGFVGFQVEQPVARGKARLVVSFEGAFDTERSRGLYKVEEGGAWYAYTFFQPIDARRAFPCFDEPHFKLPWRLTLRVPKGDLALANAPIASEKEEGGLKAVTFAESKPMPSYLVAFMVGPFDVVDAGKAGREGVALRFIVPRGRGGETRYAAEVTPRLVTLLEDYFAMPYPYEKLDVAVVPRFWGTMEHPGLVALGQPLTLIPPEQESPQRKQSYANTALHELAHYWFGDYVTMAWWDDTWLNESLASWLDTKLTDQLEPSWRVPLAHLGAREGAMTADSLVSAKRLRQPVVSRHDIEGSFDNDITYAKGAAVVGMFEHWLGEEKWRAFIHRYMAAYAWKNATTDDFLATLSAEAGEEVASAFRTFVVQPGLPRLTAEPRCAPGQPPRLVLSQQRYLPEGSRGAEAGQPWGFPVCVRYGAGKQHFSACTLLSAATGELPLQTKACPDWVLPNADGAGYYRVGYRAEELPRLLDRKVALTLEERLSVLSDARASVRRGDFPLGTVLGLVPTLSKDPEQAVVMASLNVLRLVRVGTLSDEDKGRYERFVLKTYGAQARALGWQPRAGEDETVQQLRMQLLWTVAGAAGEPRLVDEARLRARKWLDDRGRVPPGVLMAVLGVAGRYGDRALFERFVEEARETKDRRERSMLLTSLGSFREPELARAALGLVLGGGFDLRESLGLLSRAFGARETREEAWTFTRLHFDQMSPRMRDDEVLVFLENVAGSFCDERHRAELAAFFAPRVERFDGAPQVLARELEKLDLCIAASKRDGPGVTRFLSAY